MYNARLVGWHKGVHRFAEYTLNISEADNAFSRVVSKREWIYGAPGALCAKIASVPPNRIALFSYLVNVPFVRFITRTLSLFSVLYRPIPSSSVKR